MAFRDYVLRLGGVLEMGMRVIYLDDVWLGVPSRMDTEETHVKKRLEYMMKM